MFECVDLDMGEGMRQAVKPNGMTIKQTEKIQFEVYCFAIIASISMCRNGVL